MSQDVLTKALVRLYLDERFYAELALSMDKILTTSIPTAGVCIKDKIQLYVNPEFFSKLTLPEQVAVLKHECQHILHDHISRSKELAPEVYVKKASNDIADNIINSMKHKCINIAADCAINGGIPNIPKEAMRPELFNLADGMTLEWYLEQLKNIQDLEDTECDGHALWAESETDKEILKEKIRSAVNQAANKARAVGQLSREDELLVSKLNARARDWRSDLKRFVARSMEVKIESSKKRRNRRYGITVPGNVKEETLHIGVAIDTSGSISDKALDQFMSEINVISRYAKISVVEADSEIKNSYVFDPKKQYSVKGRGGTAYQPAFDHFNKMKDLDGVIYFGDMDCFDQENIKKPKYPVLWAIVGNQSPPVDWGGRVAVTVDEL